MIPRFLTPQDQLPALDFYQQINFLYGKIKEIKLTAAKKALPEIDMFKTLKIQIESLKSEKEII